MSTQPDRHAPTAEFRDRLEGEVLAATRLRPAFRSRPWLRTAALVIISLGLGAAAAAGSAQVRDNQQRARLLAVEHAELALEARRVEVARVHLAQTRQKFEVGLVGRQALAEAEAELREMEAKLARTRLDIEEIEASSIPVREDLTAPPVNGRDFVTERLRLELLVAQKRLTAAEQVRAEVQHRVEMGSVPAEALQEPRAAEAGARAEFERLAARAALREAFLRERLAPEEVSRRAQLVNLQLQLRLLDTLHQLSEERLEQTRARAHVGAAEEIELLRAQLEKAERAAEIQRLEAQLQALSRP